MHAHGNNRPADGPHAQPADPLDLCLSGAISPEVAIARLLLNGADAAEIDAMAAARKPDAPSPPWEALRDLVRRHEPALNRLHRQIARNNHSASGRPPREIAAFFDDAVMQAPEASVALYSLNDPAILAAATQELTDWLASSALLGPEKDALDLGCGIGRVAAALAPLCRSVLGLDISGKMVEEAARRCAGAPNLRFAQCSGEDLQQIPPRSLDLVLAVDSFPYIIQADRAEAHMDGIANALRPSGAVVLCNLSYGRAPEADRRDIEQWSRRYGWTAEQNGARPFRLWDGAAFVLRSRPV